MRGSAGLRSVRRVAAHAGCRLPKGSFPRQRQVVLEPVRRLGVAPAKHGTSSSIRQASRTVVEALGGPYQFWFVSRQLGALELDVRNGPGHARQVQHQLAWARGGGASPRAQAVVQGRRMEEWGVWCTSIRFRKRLLRGSERRAAIVDRAAAESYGLATAGLASTSVHTK